MLDLKGVNMRKAKCVMWGRACALNIGLNMFVDSSRMFEVPQAVCVQ